LRERKNSSIGYFVAMLCSPLAIGVHGEAIGIDDAPELAAQKCF
jgi:enoyl-[acyl-carrier-protein] reductase (NADH)